MGEKEGRGEEERRGRDRGRERGRTGKHWGAETRVQGERKSEQVKRQSNPHSRVKGGGEGTGVKGRRRKGGDGE